MRYAAVIGIAALMAAAPAHSQSKPSTTNVLALADLYLASSLKQLSGGDRAVFDSVKARLVAVQGSPAQVKLTIESLVNQLTGALARASSANGVTAASALLVKLEPGNPRVTNLFGAVLHSTARSRDAARVLELTRAQSPASVLAQLNLANAYLDSGNDAGAKRMADAVLASEPDNREAYKVIAAYWYRRNNMPLFQSALLKSSTFSGYRDRVAYAADQVIDANEVSPSMSLSQMEARLGTLEKSVPLSTADLIEAADAGVAAEIRAKHGVLPPDDRMTLPKFPQFNTSTNQSYAENAPLVQAWFKVFADRHAEYQKDRIGISDASSEAEIEAKGRAMAGKQVQEMLQGSQDAMKFLKGMKGVDQAMVNQALKQVNAAAAQQGVKLDATRAVDPESPPGFDSGSVFAKTNYRQYGVIKRSYETYLRQLFTKYRQLERDNLDVYTKKILEADTLHSRNMAQLDKRSDAPDYTVLELKERIRHIKLKNQIGDTYYKLWVNLYVPMYGQQMKPGLERYWSVVALYVRNMTAPDAIEREYERVKSFYMDNSMTAAAGAATGLAFEYAGSTEQEEAALAQAIEAAEQAAPARTVVFLKEHKVQTFAEKPGPDDWIFWTGQKFDYTVNGQFLSLHVTSRTIEFEAWAMGPSAGIKVDFEDGRVTKLDTYWALQAKFKIGVQAGGVDLTAGGTAEFARMTASWDFENGSYAEGFPTPKGSLSLKAKAGNFDASGSVKYDLTKGWTGAGASANAGFGPMTAAGEIAYSVGKGVSGSGSVTSTAGPIAAALTTEFDSQLRFQRSGNVTAGGRTVMSQDFSLGPP